jgi:hypothetical protein
MIIRTVLVKLKDEWATDPGRAALANVGQSALSAIPGVKNAEALVPADDAALASWDLMYQVHFDNLDDVETYRVHPDHLHFLDEHLNPKAEVKKVWNWSR